jgi:hypothetical protein
MTWNDHPNFTPMFNGNGLEAAEEDEGVEDTYIRLIMNTSFIYDMEDEDRESFMLSLAQQIIYRHLERRVNW